MGSITSNALRLIAFENSDMWFYTHTRVLNTGTCREDWWNTNALSTTCSIKCLMQFILKNEENIEI